MKRRLLRQAVQKPAGRITAALIGLGALALAGRAAADIPTFVEETRSSGIEHVFGGGFQYFVGGGVASFDCNDDARPDLYFAGGENRAALYVNESQPGGALRFRRADAGELSLTGVTGAYPLDVDADGQTDLMVLRVGPNILFRGQGGCRFSEANGVWGFDGGDDWSTAFSAHWTTNALFPTLAVGNYIARDQLDSPFGACADNHLYRPDESGRYARPVALRPGHCALSMMFTDWRGSGTADLRVSNDRQYYRDGSEQLWDLSSGAAPRLYGAEDGWRGLKIWGMGIAAHDLDIDGFPEYFLTSMGDNKLRALDLPAAKSSGAAAPVYRDIALARGVTAHAPSGGNGVERSTAWHAQFDDVNNDGLIDLFVTKGNVAAMEGFATVDPNNLFLGRPDGTFEDVASAAGVASGARARGAALADFNLDGALDLVVVNQGTPVQVWRNRLLEPGAQSEGAHWLQVRLVQPGANRDGVGALIDLRRAGEHRPFARRAVEVGGGHVGDRSGWIHLGLGHAASVDMRITWPDRSESEWLPVNRNRFVLIERRVGTVVPVLREQPPTR